MMHYLKNSKSLEINDIKVIKIVQSFFFSQKPNYLKVTRETLIDVYSHILIFIINFHVRTTDALNLQNIETFLFLPNCVCVCVCDASKK